MGHDCETFDVGVSTDTVLIVHGVKLLRIVQDTHSSFRVADVLIEVVFRQIESKSEDSSQATRQLQKLCVIRIETLTETRKVCWPDASGLFARVLSFRVL